MNRDPVQAWRTRRPLMLLSLCLTVGMIIGYQNAVPWWVWAAVLAVSAGVGLWRRRAVFLFSSMMLLGALVMTLALVRPAVSEQEDVLLTGVIASEPDIREEYTRVLLADAAADGEKLPTRVMLYIYPDEAASLPALEYGQTISIASDIYLPSDRGNPHADSYTAHLWQLRAALAASGSAEDLSVTAPAGPSLMGTALRCRAYLQAVVDRIYSEETAPLVSALLLGDRSLLTDDITGAFRSAGLSHLLAISGLHIACLAWALDKLLRHLRCPEKLVFVLISLFLAGYAALIGFPPSIVRAALMYIFSNVARLFSRPANGFTGLSMALAVLLLLNPLSLTDASLVLSFTSVAGLMALTRLLIPKRLLYVRGPLHTPVYWLTTALAASLAAQLGALPASIYFFDSLSTYSLLANLPALPLMTAALPAAMFSLLTGCFSPIAGQILAFPVEWMLRGLTFFAGCISALPGALVHFPRWPDFLIILYALCLFFCAPFTPGRLTVRRICLALLPVIAVFSLFLPRLLPDTNLEITFLDVGQADAALIRAENQYYLMDTGEDSTVADYLADTGVRPAGIFLSHPHADHAGGLTDVIELCAPSVLYVPCLWDDVDADEGVPEILIQAVEAGWTIRPLQAGDTIPLSDNVSAHILQPTPGMTDDANGASLVVQVTFGEASVLFTGDLPAEDEEIFFPDCDVLKVAHHGAKSSTSRLFLSMTTPSAAIISVGHNSYGHPAPETLDRLAESGAAVYRTDENGAVSVLMEADGSFEITPLFTPSESEDAA